MQEDAQQRLSTFLAPIEMTSFFEPKDDTISLAWTFPWDRSRLELQHVGFADCVLEVSPL